VSSQTGCFTDALNLRTLSGYSNSTSSNTVATCLNSCQSRGYALGGVEYGAHCLFSSIFKFTNIDTLSPCLRIVLAPVDDQLVILFEYDIRLQDKNVIAEIA